ncbi:MAG: transposase [Stellaceae bacterium]
MTEEEWAVVAALIPPAKRGGGKRRVAMRPSTGSGVVNGVMDILSPGCQGRSLPKDLPPRGMGHDDCSLWGWDGTRERLHHALYVKRSDRIRGFVVPPGRWIVERTIGWLNRCRRLAKDRENRNHNALAFLKWASIRLMLRKLCNP